MLIRFSVENYKSFNSNHSIDMLAAEKKSKHPNHIMQIGASDLKLLPLGLIYGGNASGKSNLIDAIYFAKETIRKGKLIDCEHSYCRVNSDNKQNETKFNFEICIDEKYYAYGFSAILSEMKFCSEWLYQIKIPKTNPNSPSTIPLLERVIPSKEVNIDIKNTTKTDKNRLNVYKSDFGYDESVLFLSEINDNKKINNKESLGIFIKIYNWFQNNLVIVKPNMPVSMPDYFFVDNQEEKINEILSMFDTGISGYKNEEIDIKEFKTELMSYAPEKIVDDIIDNISKEKNEVDGILRCEAGFFRFLRKKSSSEFNISTILLRHSNQKSLYKFIEESDGTRRLFDLMSILLNAHKNTTYVFDEIERSLHPMLTQTFIKKYLSIIRDKPVQLISTTHESTILNQDIIRRDEVWFVERDFDGASAIFPLRDFHERYDRKLDKAYLQGRYGGIPILNFVEDSCNDSII